MVVAWVSYADGNLQFFGNVQSVELSGECTGHDCQTEEGVTTPPPTTLPPTTLPPPPPPPGLTHSESAFILIHNCVNFILHIVSGVSIPNAVKWNKRTYRVTCNGLCTQIRVHIEFNGGDADLVANEGGHPITNGISCSEYTCTMCRSVSGNDYEETCSNMSTYYVNRYISDSQ